MKPRDAALLYMDKGWYPVPLKPKTKECRDKDWMDRVYTEDDFGDIENLGLRLVSSDDEMRAVKLVGLDLDSSEAVAAALAILPRSGAMWGRETKTISQILYTCPISKAVVFKDYCGDKKPTLLEIRVNHQSMAPPSVHPNGEELRWLGDPKKLDAPEVSYDLLLRSARLLASCAMIARYYSPSGARHDWMLALSGTLRRHGLDESEVILVVSEAAKIAGDTKIDDRKTEIHSTFSKSEDDPTTGSASLIEQMPDQGKKFVETLRRIWGSGTDFVGNEKTGRAVQSNPDNIKSALAKMDVVLAENIFANKFLIKNGNGWRELNDEEGDRIWLDIHSKYGFLPSRDLYDTVLRSKARETKIHPVLNYLSSLRWDGTPRIAQWLIHYGGASESEYTKAVGAMVLIAAVRRVRSPGCKFDELLVLESIQGKNKSTALRTLCPNEEWFSDDLPLGVDAKQIIERTSGKWIIEAAELLNMRRAHVEQLKASLSRQVDGPVRLAYGRYSTEVRRQFVIIGTTNADSYLQDSTGNRRFWPVKVRRFDTDAIAKDRDQLWAEAAHLEAGGASIRLPESLWPAAGREQEARRKEDPWEPILQSALESTSPKQRITPEEIWKILGIGKSELHEGHQERVARIMEHLGFRKLTIRKDERIVRGWGRDLVGGIFRPAGWSGGAPKTKDDPDDE